MRQRLRVVTAAPIALLAVGLMAGCSSSSSSPSASASASASASPSATSTSVSDGEASSLPAFPSATASPPTQTATSATAEQKFIASVFNDTQEEWAAIFKKAGKQYHAAR